MADPTDPPSFYRPTPGWTDETGRHRTDPQPADAADETPRTKPRCPSCGSERWVSVSLNEGVTRLAQCVPCGAYHKGVIGPGWRSPRFNDPEAVHPDYRD